MADGRLLTSGRSVSTFRRTLAYLAERVGTLGIGAIVAVIVARHLGPAGFGQLSFGMSIFALIAPLTMLGMPAVLTREFSTKPAWTPILGAALLPQLPVAVASALVGAVVVSAQGGFERESILLAIALTPLALLGVGSSLRAYLEATKRVGALVGIGLVAACVAAVVRLLGVSVDAELWVFGAGAAAQVVAMTLGFAIVLPAGQRLRRVLGQASWSRSHHMLRETWPLLIAAVSVTIFMQVDVIMLGAISGDREAGVYAAAVRLSEVWYFVPAAAVAAVRPQLSKLHAAREHAQYEQVLQRVLTATLAVSLVAVVGAIFVGPRVIDLLYGAEYARSATVLQVHVLAAPFVFLGVVANPWFIDEGLTRSVMHRSLAGAVTNLTLNAVLIPMHGALGAAMATLVSYLIAGVAFNVFGSARPLLVLQLRALRLCWPRIDHSDSDHHPGSPR